MDSNTHPHFIANGASRTETAQVLVGTAEQYGIDQHDIFATQEGFRLTEAMNDALEQAKADDDLDLAVSRTPVSESYVVPTFGPGGTDQVPAPNAGNPSPSPIAEQVGDTEPEPESEPNREDPEALGFDNEGDVTDYESWSYQDLRAEVARRDLTPANYQTANLVVALREDDAAQDDDNGDDTTEDSGEPVGTE